MRGIAGLENEKEIGAIKFDSAGSPNYMKVAGYRYRDNYIVVKRNSQRWYIVNIHTGKIVYTCIRLRDIVNWRGESGN